MMPLDRHDLAMLHILRNPELMLKALKAAKAGTDLFPIRRVPHLELLWRHMLQFVIKSKKEGHWLEWDRQEFVADCLEELKQASDMLDENKARLQAICEQYCSDKELDKEQGEKYFQAEMNEAIRIQISRAINNSEAFENIRKLVERNSESTCAACVSHAYRYTRFPWRVSAIEQESELLESLNG